MYQIVLVLHSWVRWLVILAGLMAVLRSFMALSRGWSPGDESAAKTFTIALDVQFLLGLLLYFIFSPFTSAALHDFGAAMQNGVLRYWAVEHVTGMVIAIVVAHAGRGIVSKSAPDRKARKAAIFFTIALILILGSIPWPGMPAGRPLFRI
ncbi:MAG TPA: hypothetical protein VFK20_00480 [Vicinamibacterales bacterium]|nr:hypothetical protein [Vicinamibacterales bacterium]